MKTVKDLITELLEFHPDAPVFMKSDPEGNSTHAVDEASNGLFQESRWGLSEIHPDDVEDGNDLITAVVIWPGYGATFDE